VSAAEAAAKKEFTKITFGSSGSEFHGKSGTEHRLLAFSSGNQ
jgi:hypothetical protein